MYKNWGNMQYIYEKRQGIYRETYEKRYENVHEKTMEKLMKLWEIMIHKIMKYVKYIIMIGRQYVGKMES